MIPLDIEGNRPFIELTLVAPGGNQRTARFLIDTGGGGFLLTEPLTRDLGLTWGDTAHEEGKEFGRVTQVPDVYLGEFLVRLNPNRVLVTLGEDNLLPPVAPGHADGMLPGHVLAQYHVVFDYLERSFTIADPGELTPVGLPMPMPVSKPSGFPRTELVIDGEPEGLLLDTGASFTMVSEVALKRWSTAHPEWERHTGAVGDAVTLGGQTLETIIIPTALWGTYPVSGLGIVSQREGVFERWLSSMMTAPIIGSLAGNVLKQFRVEVDYVNETLYLQPA